MTYSIRCFLILIGAFTLVSGTNPAWAQGDSCASATSITGTGVFPWDNSMATSSGEGCIGNRDLFWNWTPPADGDYHVQLVWPGPGPAFDTSLGVYRGTGCTFQDLVNCNVSPFAQGGVTVEGALATETYLIQVASWQGATGPAELHVFASPCSPQNFVDDGFEENDSLAQAVPMGAGLTTDLSVIAGDPDFYSFTIPPGHRLQIQSPTAGPGHQFFLYHNNQILFGPTILGIHYAPEASQPFDVVVEVRQSGDGPLLTRCTDYELNVSFLPTDARFEKFCNPSGPNSTGQPTILEGFVNAPQYGSEVVIGSFNGPPSQFGYLLVADQFSDPGSPLGLGELCLTGTVARYNVAGTALDSLGMFGPSGSFQSLSGNGFFQYGFLPPTDLPNPLGAIQAGDTWYFQLWHREPGGNSHLTNGLAVQY